MELSLSTGCIYIYPLRSIFNIASESGFAGVELVVSPEVELRGGRYVRCLAESYGLTIFSLHPPILTFPGWSDYRTVVPRLIDLALEAGAGYVVLHPPNAHSLADDGGRSYLEALTEGLQRTEGTDVRIALENRAFFRSGDRRYVLGDLRELRAFADKLDLPLVLDTSHAATSSYSLAEAYRIFAGRLVNVHLSDLRYPPWPLSVHYLHTYLKHHQIPGDGQLPLADFLGRLAADGYCGPITLEISPIALRIWWPPGVKSQLARCVAYVRRTFRTSPSQSASP
ncbi:MAG: sugar phosphate isomerase/epimerase family protein [Anaerolineae bacterium]